jgi:Transposase, Mutator family
MVSATVGSLAALQGNDAGGLSATNISRLTNEWETEYRAFQKRSLADRDYVYVWVDGVHFNVRLQDDRLCTLVMIGVRPDGTKELITVEDGYRESAESWKTVLRDLKRRGRGQCIRPLWGARAPRVFMARVSNSPPAHPARSKSSSWGGRSYERRSSSVDSQRAREHERHADHWHARSLPSAVGVRHRSRAAGEHLVPRTLPLRSSAAPPSARRCSRRYRPTEDPSCCRRRLQVRRGSRSLAASSSRAHGPTARASR